MSTKQEFEDMAVKLFEDFADFIKPIEFETNQDYDPMKADNSTSAQSWSGILGAINVKDQGKDYAVGDVTFKMLAKGMPIEMSTSKTKAVIDGKRVVIKGYVLDPAECIYTLNLRFA